jgi:hypothetical protein
VKPHQVVASMTEVRRALHWLTLGVLTAGLLLFLVLSVWRGSPPVFVGLFVVVALIGVWYSHLSVARRAWIDEDTLVVERPLGIVSIPIAEIWQIDARAWNRGSVSVHATSRTVFFLRGSRNLRSLLEQVVKLNPRVKLIGRLPGAGRSGWWIA